MPAGFEQLLELKGVGRYTAGAIACFAYEQQVTFWDTNVRRVLTRLFGASEAQLESVAEAALPHGQAYAWHQALMDLGATICTSRQPRCTLCPAREVCAAQPAIQAGQGMLAERKAAYKAQPFESTNRYFRGRVVDALRERSPLPLAAIAQRLQRDESDWLEGLLAGLERDGLLVRRGAEVSLP